MTFKCRHSHFPNKKHGYTICPQNLKSKFSITKTGFCYLYAEISQAEFLLNMSWFAPPEAEFWLFIGVDCCIGPPWPWLQFCLWTGSLLSTCIVSRRLSCRGRGLLLVGCLSEYLYCGLGITFPSINKSPEIHPKVIKTTNIKKQKMIQLLNNPLIISSFNTHLHNPYWEHQDMNLAAPKELQVTLLRQKKVATTVKYMK